MVMASFSPVFTSSWVSSIYTSQAASLLHALCMYSIVQLCLTLWAWTVVHQTLLSVELWTRIMEWVAISSSKGSSHPRDWTCHSCIFCIGIRIFYPWCHLGMASFSPLFTSSWHKSTYIFVGYLLISVAPWSPWPTEQCYRSCKSTSSGGPSGLAVPYTVVMMSSWFWELNMDTWLLLARPHRVHLKGIFFYQTWLINATDLFRIHAPSTSSVSLLAKPKACPAYPPREHNQVVHSGFT